MPSKFFSVLMNYFILWDTSLFMCCSLAKKMSDKTLSCKSFLRQLFSVRGTETTYGDIQLLLYRKMSNILTPNPPLVHTCSVLAAPSPFSIF